MVKENIKENIKSLAKEIKEKKAEHKSAQREFSTKWKSWEFNDTTWYHQPEKYHQITPILKLINSTRNEVQQLKINFRIVHIVNSMCKGRTISEIEPKTSNDRNKTFSREKVYSSAKTFLKDLNKEWLE